MDARTGTSGLAGTGAHPHPLGHDRPAADRVRTAAGRTAAPAARATTRTACVIAAGHAAAEPDRRGGGRADGGHAPLRHPRRAARSEEHTSELQSLMRISYAVFCLKKKKTIRHL